jgi:osmotically-inducible protein OsmY
MAEDDRRRENRDRFGYRDDERRRAQDEGDWGYPRSGRGEYGGRAAWFTGGNGDYRPDERYGGETRRGAFGASESYGNLRREEDEYRGDLRGRERDYGDSAGYGSGGSARDRREVEGYRGRERGRSGREPGFTDLAFGSGFGSGYEGRDYSGERGGPQGRRDYGRDRDERGLLERAGDEIASWFGGDDASRRGRDERGGGHRGRGPKGYRRSDERIREDVSDRLTDDHHLDASDIEVSVSGGEVTLSGTVESRFAKRHAEDLADSVSGVTHVQNNLRMRQSAGAGEGLLSGGTGSGMSGGGISSGSTTATGGGGGLRRTDLSGESGPSASTAGRRSGSNKLDVP